MMRARAGMSASPAFLPRKTLVQQSQHLSDVELNIFEIEVILVVLLHLE
jgi:hypothetical protein